MKDKSPSGLNEWLYFLKSKKLPVKSVNLARLKSQLTNTGGPLNGMQATLISDPLLAFATLNEANRIKQNKNSEIKTPTHAAAMVGMNTIAKLYPNFQAYDLTKKPTPNVIAFVAEIQTSYEAATMAKYWTMKKAPGHEDDIFWVTLFRDIAKWLLWFYAYPVMIAINNKITQGEKTSQAEISTLGCRIDEITVHLCTYWNTSPKIIDSFLSKHIPNAKEMQTLAHLAHHPNELPGFTEDKRLTILVNNPLIYSYCANKIIHDANRMGWDSKNLPFFYRVVATAMHQHVGAVIQSAHLSSVEAASRYDLKGKIPLATQLVNPELFTKKNSPKNTVALSPIITFKKALSKNNNYDIKQKANLALKTIKQAIPNTQRCIIFKHSANKISPLYQSGYDVEVLKSIKWSEPSNVFNKLISKQSANHLFGLKLNNLLEGFPHTSDQIIDNNSHLFLASTLATKNEMMIFWLETRTEFNETDFKNLKKIVSLTSHNET